MAGSAEQQQQQQQRYIVITSEWDDEDDEELIEYCASLPIPMKRLDDDEILQQRIDDIEVLFANTAIIQALLTAYTPPDTYPACFAPFYRRQLDVLTTAQCLQRPLPFFIKPRENNKAFTGFVVRDHLDLEVVKSLPESEYYVAETVKFQSEFRCFVGVLPEPKIFGIVESTRFISGRPNGATPAPPAAFLDELLAANTLGFCVIDVGYTDRDIWCVVEVNPPFALSSYDWPISSYYEYCRAAWHFIALAPRP